MKAPRKIYIWTSIPLFACCSLISLSCKKEGLGEAMASRKALFMFLPWSTDLVGYIYTSTMDMEACISGRGLKHEGILVFVSTSSTETTMFEIIYPKEKCDRKMLKKHGISGFTTVEGIMGILNDVQEFAPVPVCVMTIGSHGTRWFPVDGIQAHPLFRMKKHWECQEQPPTRYFGGSTQEFQMNVGTLARGIVDAGVKMEYTLSDDCYMSSIKAAYELRRATGFLIASASEMMVYRMFYAAVGEFLLGNPDYGSPCEGFHDFYSTYEIMPCGALAVTDRFKLDNTTTIMKSINNEYVFDGSLQGGPQGVGGYAPVIFYDSTNCIFTLCSGPILTAWFGEQLERLVLHKPHTSKFYSRAKGVFPYVPFRG